MLRGREEGRGAIIRTGHQIGFRGKQVTGEGNAIKQFFWGGGGGPCLKDE